MPPLDRYARSMATNPMSPVGNWTTRRSLAVDVAPPQQEPPIAQPVFGVAVGYVRRVISNPDGLAVNVLLECEICARP